MTQVQSGRVLAMATWKIVFRAKLGQMKMHPRVTKAAIELVKRFEGLRRRAARLPDGGWTIGYGHTLTTREGAEVSAEEAELLLFYDLSEVASRIDAWTLTPLNENQFEALTSFAFNIGLENFRSSTVLKRINEGQHLSAAAAMELWRKTEVDGEGLVADALVRRRAAEKAHYLTPPEGFQPSPSQVMRPIFDHSVIEAAAQSHAAQRVAVIWTPLDGDQAIAHVEHPAGPALIQRLPVRAIEAPGTEAYEPLLPLTPILEEAAAAIAAPEAEAITVRAAVNDSQSAQVWLEEPSAAQPMFRGFEPPPRQFARAVDAPPVAANEHDHHDPFGYEPYGHEPYGAERFAGRGVGDETVGVDRPPDAPPSGACRAEGPAAEAPEHPGDFNLFDRPLAQPEQQRPLGLHPASAPALLMYEGDGSAAAGASRLSGMSRVLQDRTVLFSSIGLLGVALFTLAIFNVLFGKATLWHLLIGILGVVLITPAGVFFLMRRTGEAPSADQAPPTTAATISRPGRLIRYRAGRYKTARTESASS
jgi:lysozyme